MAEDAMERLEALERENRSLRRQVAQLRSANQRWAHLAGTDLLTGLPNKLSFLRVLLPENIRRAAQAGHSVGFILLSADDLGTINESLGRAAGDSVLRELGAFLKTLLGHTALGHIDGAHFAVVCAPADLDATRSLAHMLRARVRGRTFADAEAHIALSAGIAALIPPPEADEKTVIDIVFHQLNQALYTAKAAGGNQVQAVDISLHRKEAAL